MNKTSILLAMLVAAAGSASAAVTLTDNGTTTPTGFNTGYTGSPTAFTNRISFDNGDSYGQTFTPTVSGNLKYLDIAYNAGGVGTFEVYIDTNFNGTQNATEAGAAGNLRATINLASLGANGLSGDSTNTDFPGANGTVYWFRLDFSTESIALVANQLAAFFFKGLTESATDDSNFIFAPHYNSSANAYATGKAISGTNYTALTNHDFGFAVTVVPEPSSALLGAVLGSLMLLRRRRR